MSDSLRDQLLKAGFAKSRPEKPRTQEKRGGQQDARAHDARRLAPPSRPASKPGREELDLARAYAIRAQTEKTERERAQREAECQARERKERKRRLHELLTGNVEAIPADAEHVRHFEHAGKIRRIHVSAEQLTRLNRGDLGVVVQGGRFVLVARDIALQARAIAPEVIALLVDPDAPTAADDGVPDDLMW